MTYSGKCFCGAVEVEVAGEPKLMGYCHCGSCRSWSAGPVNAFTLWDPENVTVTKGEEHVQSVQLSPFSIRQWCGKCGGHVLSRHPPLNVVDVFAATLPEVAFKPALHVWYPSTVLPMKDGIVKYKDFPSFLGGSGEEVPE